MSAEIAWICFSIFLVALIVFSPWMIRNCKWTKNPIYPLYNSYFQSAGSERQRSLSDSQNDDSKKGLGHFAVRELVYGEKWWETVLIPIRIFFQGQDGNPKYFDGNLNPFLFFLPFFAFLPDRKKESIVQFEKQIFTFFSVLFLLFAFFQTDMRIRWISPILPPIVILSIFGIYGINKIITHQFSKPSIKKLLNCFLYSIITALLVFNINYFIKQFQYVDPLSYISKRISREAYIERFRPEYKVIRYANQNLSENAKILVLFAGNRGYYFDREIFFGQTWLKSQVESSGSTIDILKSLKENNISHILFREDLFLNWLRTAYNSDDNRKLSAFLNEFTTHLKSHGGYSLFELSK